MGSLGWVGMEAIFLLFRFGGNSFFFHFLFSFIFTTSATTTKGVPTVQKMIR